MKHKFKFMNSRPLSAPGQCFSFLIFIASITLSGTTPTGIQKRGASVVNYRWCTVSDHESASKLYWIPVSRCSSLSDTLIALLRPIQQELEGEITSRRQLYLSMHLQNFISQESAKRINASWLQYLLHISLTGDHLIRSLSLIRHCVASCISPCTLKEVVGHQW